MKRLISLLMCICLMLPLTPSFADGAEETGGDGAVAVSEAEEASVTEDPHALLDENEFIVDGIFNLEDAFQYYLGLSTELRESFLESLSEENRLMLKSYIEMCLQPDYETENSEKPEEPVEAEGETASSENKLASQTEYPVEEAQAMDYPSQVLEEITLQYGECHLFENAQYVSVPQDQDCIAVAGNIIQGLGITQEPVEVLVDDVAVKVSVVKVKVNIILIDGQSNADGTCGYLDKPSIKPASGAADVWLWNGSGEVPRLSSLQDMNAYISNLEQTASPNSVGFGPALAAELSALTDVRCIVINTARPGAPIQRWETGYTQQTVQILDGLLSRLIEAGVYEIYSGGYYWLQGESNTWIENCSGPNAEGNYYTTAIEYRNAFLDVHKSYIAEFNKYGISGYGGILSARSWKEFVDNKPYSEYCGVRAAQQYLVNTCSDLFMVSVATDSWPRTSTSGYSYHALSGQYTVSVPSIMGLFYSVHYMQTAYDIMGLEAADSIYRGCFRHTKAGTFSLKGHNGSKIYSNGDTIYLEDNIRSVGSANYSREASAAQIVAVPEPYCGSCSDLSMTLTKLSDGSTVIGVMIADGYIPNINSVTEPMLLTVKLGTVSKSYTLARRSYYSPDPEEDFFSCIPDQNFRTMLKILDPNMTVESASQIESLSLSGLGIEDLTGIEYFTSLKDLNCDDNKLAALNLSHNTALESLSCSSNRLSVLILPNSLSYLDCSENLISAIDLSSVPSLKTLLCGNNRLGYLNCSCCENLETVSGGCQHPAAQLSAFKTADNLLVCDLSNLMPEEYFRNIADFSGIEECITDGVEPALVLLTGGSNELCYSYSLAGQGLMEVHVSLNETDHPPVSLNQSYALLNPGEHFSPMLSYSGKLASSVSAEWRVSDFDNNPSGVATVASGYVSAVYPGSALLNCNISVHGHPLCNVCMRIDVQDIPAESTADGVSISGASLCSDHVSLALYSTDYSQIGVLLSVSLPDASEQALLLPENELPEAYPSGVAIQSARFGSDAVSGIFNLFACGDRSIAIVPRYDVLKKEQSEHGYVKSQYRSEVLVTVNGVEYPAGNVVIEVNKSVPVLNSESVTIDSYYACEDSSVPVKLSGGIILAAEPDYEHYSKPIPGWVNYDTGKRSVSFSGSFGSKKSGSMKLLCTVSGWAVKLPVSIKVKSQPSTPKFKLSSNSISLNAGVGDFKTISYAVSPSKYSDFAIYPVSVTKIIEGNKVYGNGEVLDCFVSNGKIIVSPLINDGKTHSFWVYVNTAGVTARMLVKVKPQTTPALSLGVSGSIDLSVPGSSISVTPAIKNMSKDGKGYSCADISVVSIAALAPVSGEADVSSMFDTGSYNPENNSLSIKLKDGCNPSTACKYIVTVKAENSVMSLTASASFKLKQSPAAEVAPSVKIKLNGSIDTIRPGSEIVVTPIFKNCFVYTLSPDDLSVLVKSGNTLVNVSDNFNITVEDGHFIIKAESGLKAGKYAVQLNMILNGFSCSSGKPVNIKVITGKAKVKVGINSGTLLLGDRYDEVLFTLDAGSGFSRIDKVTLDSNSSQYFEIRHTEGGDWAVGWKNDQIPSGKLAIPSGKIITVKLNVFLEGGTENTANAVTSLKIIIR